MVSLALLLAATGATFTFAGETPIHIKGWSRGGCRGHSHIVKIDNYGCHKVHGKAVSFDNHRSSNYICAAYHDADCKSKSAVKNLSGGNCLKHTGEDNAAYVSCFQIPG